MRGSIYAAWQNARYRGWYRTWNHPKSNPPAPGGVDRPFRGDPGERHNLRNGLGQVQAKGAGLFHSRGGKVTRYVIYLDRERALRELGLSGQDSHADP